MMVDHPFQKTNFSTTSTTFNGAIGGSATANDRGAGRSRVGSVSKRAFCTIDLMPTFAHLAGAALPSQPIDGKNVWELIRRNAPNPHEYYAFSTGVNFEGVISGDGKWKLHVPHSYRVLIAPGNDGAAGKYRQEKIELSLFDMEKDPFETTNVIGRYPEIAAKMQRFADRHRAEFYA